MKYTEIGQFSNAFQVNIQFVDFNELLEIWLVPNIDRNMIGTQQMAIAQYPTDTASTCNCVDRNNSSSIMHDFIAIVCYQ